MNRNSIKYISAALIFAIIFAAYAKKLIRIADSVNASVPQNGITILIDPGHGGKDPGATGSAGNKESVLNMQVALFLREYLLQSGYNVIMTRGDDGVLGADTWLSSADRKRIIKEASCDMVVSVHMNKFTDPAVHGAEVHYHPESENGKRLAEGIQAFLRSELDPENKRTAKASKNLFTLNMNTAPSVLVECGYISNPEEEQKLASDVYQRRAAFAIFCGIQKYFNAGN